MRQDDFASIWKALAEPARRQILDLLRQRPYTTGELTEQLGLSRYAVMKHLASLEHSGLITVRKQGRQRWNHLNPVPLQLISERWLRPYEATWARSLLQLKEFVEGGDQMTGTHELGPLETVHVELEVTIAAAPEAVFEALTRNVSAWWGPPYLHGDATDLVLEPRIGGRLYEVWGEDEGVLWATVTSLRRPRELRLTGPMGMPEPTHGVVTFQLEPQADATSVRLLHEAFGKIGKQTRASYEAGWKDLLDIRLRALVERGVRHGINQGTRGFFASEPRQEPTEPTP
jgi:DNA-binding transcriptional ArsR family regulator/uncharacterized protein YndB with AHSA1/START domain